MWNRKNEMTKIVKGPKIRTNQETANEFRKPNEMWGKVNIPKRE